VEDNVTHASGGYPPQHAEQEPPSTPEVAKQQAAEVGQTAAQGGQQVAQTAGEQTKRVVSETGRQARDLLHEGRQQLADQAREGQQKAAGSLHALADQLDEMHAKSDGSGMGPEVVRQAAGHTRTVASWLEDRQPGDLLNEVRGFARRKPGVFLAGAALAGVLVGRLTRGVVDAQRDDSDDSQQRDGRGPAPVQAVNPALAPQPAYPPTYTQPPAQQVQPDYRQPPAPSYSQPPAQVPPGYAPPPWQGEQGQVRP
jgi:hypothetical protein